MTNKNITSYKFLNKKEERDLILRAKNGDIEAKNSIIINNQNFIRFIIKKYFIYQNTENINDLIEEGNLGLIEAIHNFDFSKNTRFTTFAVNYIKKNILNFINKDKNFINASTYTKRYASKIKKIRTAYYLENNREISNKEIYEKLNKKVSLNKIKEINDYIFINQSAQYYENDFVGVIDVYDFNHNDESLLKKYIEQLSEKEKTIIEYRYGLNKRKPLTLQEIGDILNLSRERVRQILKKSLYKLKILFNESKLLK